MFLPEFHRSDTMSVNQYRCQRVFLLISFYDGTDLPYLAATDQMGSPWIHQESEQHDNFFMLKCLLYIYRSLP
jgi:hypothetical protein